MKPPEIGFGVKEATRGARQQEGLCHLLESLSLVLAPIVCLRRLQSMVCLEQRTALPPSSVSDTGSPRIAAVREELPARTGSQVRVEAFSDTSIAQLIKVFKAWLFVSGGPQWTNEKNWDVNYVSPMTMK